MFLSLNGAEWYRWKYCVINVKTRYMSLSLWIKPTLLLLTALLEKGAMDIRRLKKTLQMRWI